jgi:hypothetical protein
MVVVDNARQRIGKTVDIAVTSVLQTTAGRMIFGRYLEHGGGGVQDPAGRPVERVERDEPARRRSAAQA